MAITDLNRVRYAGLDFDTHEDEIIARMQVKFASVYNDFAASSLGIMLIDIVSFGLDSLSWYLDRRVTDLFLSTARTRKSVARTARQLGYKMSPATASSVDVEISPSQAYAMAITLPVGFKLTGPNGLVFESRESYTWPISNTDTALLTFSEGETIQTVFASDGKPGQVFEIRNVPDGKFIVGPGSDGVSQVVVEVAGDAWEEQELLTFGDTNQFEIGYNDDPPTLRFGDGIAGKIPEQGAEIRITYFASTGANGSATSGTITTAKDQLVVAFTDIELDINNPEGTSGGADPETLEKAKSLAPKFFKARGVNITSEDYEARASAFSDPVYGAIAVAKAVNVRSASVDAFLLSQLDSIKTVAASFPVTIGLATDGFDTIIDTIDTRLGECQDKDVDLEAEMDTIGSKSSDIYDNADTARTAASVAQLNSEDAVTQANTLIAAINAISTAGTSQLTSATKTALTDMVNVIKVKAQKADTESTSAASTLGTISTDAGTIITAHVNADILRQDIRDRVDLLTADTTGFNVAVLDLKTGVSLLESDVSAYADAIQAHVDGFLSADCKANLVEVPVLTKDSDGFYVVPTIGLMRSLQAYLDAKKEVTQVVKVVGASNLLVAADVSVHVGVLPGFPQATIRSQVEASVLNVLKNRVFGDNLDLSELYWPISPEAGRIDGIDFINVKITGPSLKIDSGSGTLVVGENEVVTKGVIAVTSESVPARG